MRREQLEKETTRAEDNKTLQNHEMVKVANRNLMTTLT